MTLVSNLEQLLLKSIQQAQKAGAEEGAFIEPSLADKLQQGMQEAAQRRAGAGRAGGPARAAGEVLDASGARGGRGARWGGDPKPHDGIAHEKVLQDGRTPRIGERDRRLRSRRRRYLVKKSNQAYVVNRSTPA